MKNSNSNSKIKALVILLSILSGILFLVSIVLQSSIIDIEHAIIKYGEKHHFIIGLISFFVFTISFAIFRALDTTIQKRFNRKNSQTTKSNEQKIDDNEKHNDILKKRA
jgi:hypothetical protein